MITCYRKLKEQTSTSPSLRHIGYYKCLITSDGTELNPTMIDLTLSILQVHNTILNTSVTSEIPLNCWIIADVMMIQKEPNNPKINELRVLNKLEADYNLVLKYHWPHQTTYYAKKRNFLVKTNGVPALGEVPIPLFLSMN